MFINDSKLLSRCALLGVALLGTACTFERGTAYASVESAQLDVRFDPGAARDLGGNTVLTDLGYAVHVSSFTLDIGDLSLQELKSSGSESQGSFDPANPPPGYSSCHGGHC
ncbi:MAG TPA: hypothetical protein PKA88_33040, partial [Polyangiaceae bacterium]|nr:hypothetical protein [Polyangiaceae bacterium]